MALILSKKRALNRSLSGNENPNGQLHGSIGQIFINEVTLKKYICDGGQTWYENTLEFFSIAELRTVTSFKLGDTVRTLSYDGGDIGGNEFICVEDTSQVDNECTIIRADNNIVFEAKKSSEINLKQAGAKGDYATNEVAFLRLETLGIPIKIDEGVLELNDLELTLAVEKLHVKCDNVIFKLCNNNSQIRTNNIMLFLRNKNKIIFEGNCEFNGNINNNSSYLNDTSIKHILLKVEAKEKGTSLSDSIENTFFRSDNIIFKDCYVGFYLRGRYSLLSSTETYFNNISIGNVYIHNYYISGLSIHMPKSVINIKEIYVYQTDRCLNVNSGSKAVSYSIEATDFEEGASLYIDKIEGNYSKDMVFFTQNLFYFHIKSIVGYNNLFNPDGSDSNASSFGYSFMKLDNALSPNDVEKRSGRIDSLILKGSNISLAITQPDGITTAGVFRRGLTLDDGVSEIDFGNVDIDLPFGIGSGEYSPNFTGNFKFKTFTLRNNIGTSLNQISNCEINELNLIKSNAQLTDSFISSLKSVSSKIYILPSRLRSVGNASNSTLTWGSGKYKEITIKQSSFDASSVFEFQISDSNVEIKNQKTRCAYIKFNLSNHYGGFFRFITNSVNGLYDIEIAKERLQLNFTNVVIQATVGNVLDYFSNKINSLLSVKSVVSGTVDLTDIVTYPPVAANSTPELGLKDLPESINIGSSKLVNSTIVPHNRTYADMEIDHVSKRNNEDIIVSAGGYTYVDKGNLDYNSFKHQITARILPGKNVIAVTSGTGKEGDVIIIFNQGTIINSYSTLYNRFINLSGSNYTATNRLHYYKINGGLSVEFDILNPIPKSTFTNETATVINLTSSEGGTLNYATPSTASTYTIGLNKGGGKWRECYVDTTGKTAWADITVTGSSLNTNSVPFVAATIFRMVVRNINGTDIEHKFIDR